MSSLVKLQAKKKNALMSLSETDEQPGPSNSGLHAEKEGTPGVEIQKACTIQAPKELEDFVLPQDPSNINRTRVALSDLSPHGMEILKKIMILTDMHEKSSNKFARSGIASQGTAIHMGAKTGRGPRHEEQGSTPNTSMFSRILSIHRRKNFGKRYIP
eukprot:4047432-Amphidinium_carterae.1